MKTIDVEQLRAKGACEDQVQLFQETFGDTLELKSKDHALKLAKNMAQDFDFNWAAWNLLNDFKAYEEAVAQLFAEMYWDQEG